MNRKHFRSMRRYFLQLIMFWLLLAITSVRCVTRGKSIRKHCLNTKKPLISIRKLSPANHPDLATPYNNIGAVYYNMGECLEFDRTRKEKDVEHIMCRIDIQENKQ